MRELMTLMTSVIMARAVMAPVRSDTYQGIERVCGGIAVCHVPRPDLFIPR
jgi:hypothetical protein